MEYIGDPTNDGGVRLADAFSNRGIKSSYTEFSGKFTVKDNQIINGSNLLSIYLKNDNEKSQTFYIDFVSVEFTERFGPIVNYGTLNFDTKNQLETAVASNSSVGIVKDGDKNVLAINADGGINLRLPVKVQNGKDISVAMKLKIVSVGNSDWFHGGSYFDFRLGNGAEENGFKLYDLNNKEGILRVIYNFKNLEASNDYFDVRAKFGVINNASDGLDYVCIRYKGDATIYIDEITFRDGSGDIYGYPLDDPQWKLPDEPDSDFILWKNWVTNENRVFLSSAGEPNENAQNITKEDTKNSRSGILLIITVSVSAVLIAGAIVLGIRIKKRKQT